MTSDMSIFLAIVVGESQNGEVYGGYKITSATKLTGMQAVVNGNVPLGAALAFDLCKNGTVVSGYHISVADGTSRASVTFNRPLEVVAGDVISVQCSSVGVDQPGDWVQINLNATVQVVF
jgi:hypothetical protein